MIVSPEGLDIIKSHEGLRLSAYQDSVNVWTIGYGTTSNVKPGQTISLQQAEEFLRRDVRVFEAAVKANITVPLAQNQYDALVSLVYNIGPGNFKKSPVVKAVNTQAPDKVLEAAFLYHSYGRGGVFLNGLKKRRLKEFELFKKKTQEPTV